MPNWIYSTITFSGSEEAVHKLIKIGLENSRLHSTGNMRRDFGLLVSEGKTQHPNTDTHQVELVKGLTARTFLPSPETFLLYDTTNYPDKYPEAAKEQQERYGVVGWYDYNIQSLGVKWDFDLAEFDLQPFDELGIWTIHMDTETAWDYPDQWLIQIKEMVPELDVSIRAVLDVDNNDNLVEFWGYVENGELVEGLSQLEIEMRRLMIEDNYKDTYPTAVSVAVEAGADGHHPVIREMKEKGYRLVEHDTLGNTRNDFATILTFSK